MSARIHLPERLGGDMEVRYVAMDFTGTVSKDGFLICGVDERIRELDSLAIKICFLTADTHGKASTGGVTSPCDALDLILKPKGASSPPFATKFFKKSKRQKTIFATTRK